MAAGRRTAPLGLGGSMYSFQVHLFLPPERFAPTCIGLKFGSTSISLTARGKMLASWGGGGTGWMPHRKDALVFLFLAYDFGTMHTSPRDPLPRRCNQSCMLESHSDATSRSSGKEQPRITPDQGESCFPTHFSAFQTETYGR